MPGESFLADREGVVPEEQGGLDVEAEIGAGREMVDDIELGKAIAVCREELLWKILASAERGSE